MNLADLPEDELFAALPEGIPKDWTDADIQLGGSLIRLSNRTHPTLDPMATVSEECSLMICASRSRRSSIMIRPSVNACSLRTWSGSLPSLSSPNTT